MTFEEHCQESERLFGNRYEEVHKWLDEFAGKEAIGMRHRKKRHHELGIRKAIELYGEKAGEVARQHIVSDLKQEGWAENDPFPRDEAHYIEIGFF